MSSCPPDGNRGLPIIIQGAINSTQLNSIKAPPTIELKPSARTTYPTIDNKFVFNEASMTTMRIGTRTYNLMWSQIIQTINKTYYTGLGVGEVIAEFVLWFRSGSDKSIYSLFVPILQGSTLNNGGKYISAALKKDTSYRGSVGDILNKRSINYQTCIEYLLKEGATDISTLPINVLVFLDGIVLDVETKNKLIQAGTLPIFGIPVSLLPSVDIQTLTTPSRKLANGKWSTFTVDESKSPTRQIFSRLISTGDDSFIKKFVYYPITFITTATENAKKAKAASAFKCIPLDPTKHVKNINGAMIIDLDDDTMENAGTLQDEFNTQNADKPDIVAAGNSGSIVAIVVGTIIGASMAAGVLYLGFRMITRKTASQITS